MTAIERLSLGPIGTNCYVVRAATDAVDVVVVDPSGGGDELGPELARRGIRCGAILVTHGHFDHVFGVADLAEATGAEVTMPEGERFLLERAAELTPPGITVRPWPVGIGLTGGETIERCGVTFEVIAVPGHSPAHVAYVLDGVLLSGDVLFKGSVGRTDLPGGDWPTLLASIELLVERFPGETQVLPGHGEPTTLAAELATNPFLGPLRDRR
ncbi:MAG: MBL fold metallo-hydrolase [Gaiellales bacterium]